KEHELAKVRDLNLRYDDQLRHGLRHEKVGVVSYGACGKCSENPPCVTELTVPSLPLNRAILSVEMRMWSSRRPRAAGSVWANRSMPQPMTKQVTSHAMIPSHGERGNVIVSCNGDSSRLGPASDHCARQSCTLAKIERPGHLFPV
ncbi:hypothetical protein M404DRAFT_963424, partial [Pisolithus tinctorius Marx 270]